MTSPSTHEGIETPFLTRQNSFDMESARGSSHAILEGGATGMLTEETPLLPVSDPTHITSEISQRDRLPLRGTTADTKQSE